MLKARREHQEATRRKIVEAIVALHEEVGPRRTSIKAIAERAGVERLTVYRHFPDESSLLQACSACWAERNPPPDPTAWQGLAEPSARTAAALDALFAYYRRTSPMLAQIHRDLPEMPALVRVTHPFFEYLRRVADELAAAWPARRGSAAREAATRLVLRQVVRFDSWRLLEQAGWSDVVKRDLLLRWVRAAVDTP